MIEKVVKIVNVYSRGNQGKEEEEEENMRTFYLIMKYKITIPPLSDDSSFIIFSYMQITTLTSFS
jgi:hypothetical protein